MDFALNEEQQSVRDLSARIFGDLSDHEHLKAAEDGAERFDRGLWRALAEAGLLGMAVPEGDGGAGLGLIEACVAIEEAGRAAALVPLTAVTITGALPIAKFGSALLRDLWLEQIVEGSAVVTAALTEAAADPLFPATTAKADGYDWVVTGSKSFVPAATVADALIVPARSDDGVGLFVVDPGADGVTVHPQEATDRRLEGDVELAGVRVPPGSVLVAPGGGAGEKALEWTLERAAAALCVEVAGACQAAVKLTATYTSERKQFDKAIATFQAVGQRAADAYIDTEAVRLTAWQAVWRLANDLPATAEVAVAKFWADDGAQRVVHAAQHLHGGVGVDRDYPLHRYYLLVKHLALSLGGGTASLLRLGDILAGDSR